MNQNDDFFNKQFKWMNQQFNDLNKKFIDIPVMRDDIEEDSITMNFNRNDAVRKSAHIKPVNHCISIPVIYERI